MDVDDAEQDWRLEAELDVPDSRSALHGLLGRLRGPQFVQDVEVAVAPDVAITHDGRLLFAYAASEAALAAARNAIEGALERDGIGASIRLSRWDGDLDAWQQTDPPATAQQQQIEQASEREAEALETRTMVASSGKLVRSEFEQTMRTWADRLGLKCEVIEHPHLLTTQVAFTVTGPKRKVEEFAQGLVAEGWAMVRTETGVMLSPL